MMAVMRKAILLLTLATLLAGVLAGGAEDELRQTEKNWAAAVVAQDYAKLEQFLHDQLIYAHSTGVIETKADYLGKLKSGKQRYDAIDHHKMEIRAHGDAAIVHSLVTMKGQSGDRPFDNELMMIHTWVKQSGQWRLAAHQTTRLEK